jgi:hypothetical protein
VPIPSVNHLRNKASLFMKFPPQEAIAGFSAGAPSQLHLIQLGIRGFLNTSLMILALGDELLL